MSKLNSYELSRAFFDFVFENPDIVKPTHIAVYFYCVEHCNRLGWKSKFGLPSLLVREIVGIKNFRTYDSTLKDLIAWKFIKLHQKSTNQYTANIISLMQHNLNLNDFSQSSLDSSISRNNISTSFINTSTSNLSNIDDRIKSFIDAVNLFSGSYDDDLISNFIKYWTEKTTDNKYFKAELQKTFSIETRLTKWKQLDVKFKTQNNGNTKPAPATTDEIINTLNNKFSDLK